VRTVAGLGWPTEEGAESSDLGWPDTSPQTDLSTSEPGAVSRETAAEKVGGPSGEQTDAAGDDGAGAPFAEDAGQPVGTEAESVAPGDPPAQGDALGPGDALAPDNAEDPDDGEDPDDAKHPEGASAIAGTTPATPPVPVGPASAVELEASGAPDVSAPDTPGEDARPMQAAGTAPQAYVEDRDGDPVSRETPTQTEETMPHTDGLPDTTTQDVEQARFGPTLSPTGSPLTAAQIAAQTAAGSGAAYADPDTPLAAATHEEILAGKRPAPQLPRPGAPRVMVIANQKGGVGKTTTTVNMAAGLAQHGLRVLIIDLDPQGNASTALGIDHSAGTPGVYEVMADGTPMKEVIRECPDVLGLYGVPATIDLAGAEIELVSLVARESRLRKALDSYLASVRDGEERFDYVFIDCPPSLGLLTINALVAGREMLIPIQCEYYALEGVTQLLRNVDMVRAHLNPDLQVSTIVLTMYDGRTRLAAGVADEVRQHFGDVVLRTAIPRSVRISEAPSYGQTVMTYDPTSSGALSYLEAARELATHYPHQTEEQ
jgi:chromosome partitioning protein